MSALWPLVRLGDLLEKSNNWIELQPLEEYRQVTIKLWGRGVVERGRVLGSAIAADAQRRVKAGDFILSRIDARNGALGVVPEALDGAVVSTDFPSYRVHPEKLVSEYLAWMSRAASFVELCRRASVGTTNRVRLKAETFLAQEIPLPPLAEQRRLVARIAEAAAGWQRARLGDGMRFVDDSVNVRLDGSYPNPGIFSYAKGLFHKPPIEGDRTSAKTLRRVPSGQFIYSRLFAFEGAYGMVTDE